MQKFLNREFFIEKDISYFVVVFVARKLQFV